MAAMLADLVEATIVLTLAEFPPGATPDAISEETLFKLGAYYAPTIFTVWMITIGCISLYHIDRDTHEENLRELGRD